MACSLVITPTPCIVAGCNTSIRLTYSHALMHLLTYLFTYLHSLLGEHKAGDISETVEYRAKLKLLLTAYIKSYMGFRLPPICMTLNDL